MGRQLILDLSATARPPLPPFARVACPACGAGIGRPCRGPDGWESVQGVRDGVAAALEELEGVAFGLPPTSMWESHAPHRAWLAGAPAERCFPKLRSRRRDPEDDEEEAA